MQFNKYPTEQEIIQYNKKHNKTVNAIADLYDHKYKEYLTQNKMSYRDNILINRIDYDSLRQHTDSLQSYTHALYEQITYSTYLEYIDKFYSALDKQIDKILYNEPGEAILYCIFIRVVYNFYKGAKAEQLIQDAINRSDYLSVSYDAQLDMKYGVDLTVSNGSQSLALQIKSRSNLEHTKSRMESTNKKLSKYKEQTGTPYTYLFYDSNSGYSIRQRQIGTSNKYLFTYEEIEQVQKGYTKGLTYCPIDNIVNYLETVLWILSIRAEEVADNE